MTPWKKFCLAATSVAAICATSTPAQAGTDAYLGEIQIFGFNFCPRGTAALDGQILAISSNSALFSLLGTTYGGDGRTTFQLPDLRGRVPMHYGSGPGLSSRSLGQRLGEETNTLSTANLPSHNHNPRINVSRANGALRNPIGAYMARHDSNGFESATAPTGDQMHAGAVTETSVGGGVAVNNIQPSLALNYCIATVGVFPSRN